MFIREEMHRLSMSPQFDRGEHSGTTSAMLRDSREAEESQMLRAGVDLGGTKIQTVIMAPDNTILGSHRCLTPTDGGPADVAEAIAGAVRASIEDGLVDPLDVTALGLGSPGQIDAAAGTVSNAATCRAGRDHLPSPMTLLPARPAGEAG
jgi:activator of 2-hydroxyglutaryl-CoA dehydratase